jgi:hypothetical protein
MTTGGKNMALYHSPYTPVKLFSMTVWQGRGMLRPMSARLIRFHVPQKVFHLGTVVPSCAFWILAAQR